jgi:hypothetical protein
MCPSKRQKAYAETLPASVFAAPVEAPKSLRRDIARNRGSKLNQLVVRILAWIINNRIEQLS